jgi:hypothetical protein
LFLAAARRPVTFITERKRGEAPPAITADKPWFAGR